MACPSGTIHSLMTHSTWGLLWTRTHQAVVAGLWSMLYSMPPGRQKDYLLPVLRGAGSSGRGMQLNEHLQHCDVWYTYRQAEEE